MSTFDIHNLTRRIMRAQSGIPDRRMMHPVRDWFIGLVLAILTLGGVSLYAGYTFMQHTSSGAVSVEHTAPVRYEAEDVADALERYRTRNERFQALRVGLPYVPPRAVEQEKVGTSTSATEVSAQ